ncbi:killer cell lectin-like receptor subfamily F member 1 [Anticarsia gemmatalis]|uniref:killer cell lectin-like receptor subfamily F member 1 n=1 Tax=Anticarsia gemmatalis TaxID=129554 RepID=UPI003F76127A
MSNKLILFCALLSSIVLDAQAWYVYHPNIDGWMKVHEPASWEDAYATCWREGTLLASPINLEMRHEMETVSLQNTSYHTGITLMFYPGGQFASLEGIPIHHIHMKIHDSEGSFEQCLSMEHDVAGSYLKKVNCSAKRPFICYRKRDHTTKECGTSDKQYKFIAATGSCYKMHTVLLPWNDAFKICRAEGGHLVVINDELEQQEVNKLITWSQEWVSVGLRQYKGTGDWMSVQGDHLEQVYNVWQPAREAISHIFPQRQCCVINKLGKLHDIKCDDDSRNFFCEKDPNHYQFV